MNKKNTSEHFLSIYLSHFNKETGSKKIYPQKHLLSLVLCSGFVLQERER